jgi:phosphoglycerate dehydrogenase-like enzyme
MMGWKVLTTARAFWNSGEEAQARLEAAGCTVVRSSVAGPLTVEALLEEGADADAIIASMEPFNATTLPAMPNLKLIARCGVGIDAVDLNAATENGVILTNTPGAMSDAVADFTFALMLGLARHIAGGDALMRRGDWGELRGTTIWGATIGIVGFGSIGQAVALRAAGFHMRILACDPYQATRAENFPGIEFVNLDTLLAESDFVSLNAPNTAETSKLFNRERFAKMKPSGYFINTARGALVDEDALLEALNEGVIAGAAIDVYDKEPLARDHPLRSAKNTLLAPHNAFNTVQAAESMSALCADSVLALMNGLKPGFVCNPDVLTKGSLRAVLAD